MKVCRHCTQGWDLQILKLWPGLVQFSFPSRRDEKDSRAGWIPNPKLKALADKIKQFWIFQRMPFTLFYPSYPLLLLPLWDGEPLWYVSSLGLLTLTFIIGIKAHVYKAFCAVIRLLDLCVKISLMSRTSLKCSICSGHMTLSIRVFATAWLS